MASDTRRVLSAAGLSFALILASSYAVQYAQSVPDAVAGGAADVSVSGLAATVDLQHAEPADALDLETFDGINTLVSNGLAAGTLQLFFDGTLVP